MSGYTDKDIVSEMRNYLSKKNSGEIDQFFNTLKKEKLLYKKNSINTLVERLPDNNPSKKIANEIKESLAKKNKLYLLEKIRFAIDDGKIKVEHYGPRSIKYIVIFLIIALIFAAILIYVVLNTGSTDFGGVKASLGIAAVLSLFAMVAAILKYRGPSDKFVIMPTDPVSQG